MSDGPRDMSAAMFSRSRADGSVNVDLRGECPKDTVDMLDAISLARNYPSRTALVNEILGDWAKQQRHEHTVVARVLGLNPAAPETLGAGK